MQTEIRLRVFQGEARKVKENFELGELLVTDIPPTKDPQSVRVRFTYDLNGVAARNAPGCGGVTFPRPLVGQRHQ